MPLPMKRVSIGLPQQQAILDPLLFNVDAEAWARGKRDGQPVANTDPTYHDNSYYWSTQAADSATAAASAALTGNLAPEFDATQAYSEGDYVIYNGKLWCFTVDHAAGAWTGEDAEDQYVSDIIEAIKSDIIYTPVSISTFSSSITKAEIGSTVTAATLTYTINKTPTTLTLDGNTITPTTSGTQDLTGLSLTSNKTWTLVATDSGSFSNPPATSTKTVTLSFLYKVYWGAAISGTLDSAFVLGLSDSDLTSTRARSITVNAGANQYIWYAVPTSFGACTFKVNGFEGGFETAQTVSVTNASGATTNYYVYRSTNAALGNTTVVIS